MSNRNSKTGSDVAALLTMLRAHGVVHYRDGEFEVSLGPVALPPRELEDFATTGTDSALEDDARWDHVGIRLRREVPS